MASKLKKTFAPAKTKLDHRKIKIITHSEKDSGKIASKLKGQENVYSNEEVERFDSVDLHDTMCEKMERTSDEKKKAFYTDQRKRNKKFQKDNPYRKKWVATEYFRKDLQRRKDFKTAADNYVYAPINFRRHRFGVEGTNDREALRLGAICDPTNGFTNLKELKEFKGNPEKLEAKIEELKKGKAECQQNKGTQKQLESYDYAIHELENLEDTLVKRREGMNLQMLSYIEGHMTKENLENTKEGDPFFFFQLSLLNPEKRSLDKTGWMHDEANMMLDMAEIFKEFAGKTVVCDGEGPYIDDEGVIHLSKKIEGEEGNPRKITIHPLFANVSVQGCTKNVPPQTEINKDLIENVYNLDPSHKLFSLEEKQKLNQRGVREASNYSLAIKMVRSFQDHIPVGVNCAGAKDRTSLVVHSLVVKRGKEHLKSLEDNEKISKKEAARAKRHLRTQIFSTKSAASEMAYQNTREKILKIAPIFIRGYRKPKELATRIKYYGQQTLFFAKDQLKNR